VSASSSSRVAVRVDPSAPAAGRSTDQLRSDIEKKRDDLRSTLDAIEFKLNVPKQARHAAHLLKGRFNRLRAENPTAVAAGVAGSAVLLVGVAVLGFRAASRR
jgi:hypothetical protein